MADDLENYTPIGPPQELSGMPGRAVVGTNTVQVGVQPPYTQTDLAAWQARQPNLSVQIATQRAIDKAVEDNFMADMARAAQVQQSAKAIESAMRFQGLRGYERDLEALTSAGIPRDQAQTQALARNAGRMFWSSPATALKAMTPVMAPFTPTVTELGGVKGVRQGLHGERFTPLQDTGFTEESRKRVGTEMTTPTGLHAVWVGPNQIRLVEKTGELKDFTVPQLLEYAQTKQLSRDKADQAKAKEILDFLGQKVQKQIAPPPASVPRGTGATGIIHPWPKSKSELVVGDLYEHPTNGVGRWNGKVFEAVEVR